VNRIYDDVIEHEFNDVLDREFNDVLGNVTVDRVSATTFTWGSSQHSCETSMPQSLANVLVHIVFSTKYRAPLLYPEVRPALFAYLAAIARNHGCECYRAGGVANHVHLAVRLSRMITIAGLVQELKSSSSRWLKTQSPRLSKFRWQEGYSVFSVRASGLNTLVRYIENQEEHHRKRSFEREHRAILDKEGIEYDERYVWD